MSRRLGLGLLLGSLAIASGQGGCASPRPLLLNSDEVLGADDYEDVLGLWSRADEVYYKLDSVLFAHATFHSSEVRRAFALEHPNVYGPGSEEARRLLLLRPDAEAAHEFFLSASTREQSWNDFDKPDSIWRITLQTDELPAVDGQVERVKTSANLRVIYPYITDFARTYSVRFPLTVDGQPVLGPTTKVMRLSIISALGTATMTWRLTAESERKPRAAKG